jgi:hypothetical protein
MVSQLVGEFNAYSKESLVAMAGGLHIVPANHSHVIRLDAASYAAVRCDTQSNRVVSNSEFHRIMNDCI